MDIRKVKKLIELLEVSDVDEIEIREGEESVRLSRNRVPAQQAFYAPLGAAPAAMMPFTPPAQAQAPPDAEPVPPVLDGHVITSPMVGTFYVASAPGETPFVQEGSRVQIGDTVCIIEAMKILNQIEADASGMVIKVLAEDGQPVEYEQPLYLIDTDA
ncbi:MAG: acetyl-CoA carboxylase biotin carboxyl carrier protein [Gammaproteobacteria bacterium]